MTLPLAFWIGWSSATESWSRRTHKVNAGHLGSQRLGMIDKLQINHVKNELLTMELSMELKSSLKAWKPETFLFDPRAFIISSLDILFTCIRTLPCCSGGAWAPKSQVWSSPRFEWWTMGNLTGSPYFQNHELHFFFHSFTFKAFGCPLCFLLALSFHSIYNPATDRLPRKLQAMRLERETKAQALRDSAPGYEMVN